MIHDLPEDNELLSEIARLEQDLEGALADHDHRQEEFEREREARCRLMRRLDDLLREWARW